MSHSIVPQIVTQPLGLIGFVLALVFAALARSKPADGKWMRPLIYILAVGCACGGFFLAYRSVKPDAPAATAANSQLHSSPDAGAVSTSTPRVQMDVQDNRGGTIVGIVQGDATFGGAPASNPDKARSK